MGMNVATALLSIALLAAVPPLDDTQQQIIASAQDDSLRLDEAAWYPLLRNAAQWQAGDEAGARIPDYDALLDTPADLRGELFLIEGRFAGRPRAIVLARPGPWGERVTEWVIQTDPENDEVAVVYLVDQPIGEGVKQPMAGQQVRVAARFYKVWSQRDLNNQPQRFLTFVGHSLTYEGLGPAPPITNNAWQLALGLLVMIGAALFFGRRMLSLGKPRPLPSRVLRERDLDDAVNAGQRDSEESDDEPDLPDDPDAALAELEKRAERQALSE